jgi:hypothetical protein
MKRRRVRTLRLCTERAEKRESEGRRNRATSYRAATIAQACLEPKKNTSCWLGQENVAKVRWNLGHFGHDVEHR